MLQAEKPPHMGYRAFAVFVFLFIGAFYCGLWWYYRQHRCSPALPSRMSNSGRLRSRCGQGVSPTKHGPQYVSHFGSPELSHTALCNDFGQVGCACLQRLPIAGRDAAAPSQAVPGIDLALCQGQAEKAILM